MRWSRRAAGVGYHANQGYWDGLENMISLWQRMGFIVCKPPSTIKSPLSDNSILDEDFFVEMGRDIVDMESPSNMIESNILGCAIVQFISEIIVAGNGLSGISTVVSLSQKGHSVTWINQDRNASDIPWTESIQLRSLDYLSNFIDLKNILQTTNIPQVPHFSCWGSNELTQKHIASKPSGKNDLILIDKAEFVRLIKKSLNHQPAISGKVKK